MYKRALEGFEKAWGTEHMSNTGHSHQLRQSLSRPRQVSRGRGNVQVGTERI